VDWTEWHELYELSPSLTARLMLVRAHITRHLDTAPAGPIRILSVCAGDGRDLIAALSDHPRAGDVRARLVELDAGLAGRGREMADTAGLSESLDFVAADATAASAYRGFAPADLVLACGVFGNVRKADTPRLVESLASLCTRGGSLTWTRRLATPLARGRAGASGGGPGADAVTIQSLLRQRSFVEVQLDRTPDGVFLVGTCRHDADPHPLPADERPLFVFTGGLAR
jgi:hypothetical protein